jgi:hypothetical protein
VTADETIRVGQEAGLTVLGPVAGLLVEIGAFEPNSVVVRQRIDDARVRLLVARGYRTTPCGDGCVIQPPEAP